jgi:hypothetical protein
MMYTNEELDDLIEDGDEVTDHRARARAELDQIARLAKQALAEQKIALDLFFLVPNSGQAILMFGTPADPDDELWEQVDEIVSAIVREVVGTDGTTCRQVTCSTTTDAVAGNEHSPMPIHTQSVQLTGADQ